VVSGARLVSGPAAKRLGVAALLWAAGCAWAHGAQAPRNPWVEGARSLVQEPACVLLLLALALWLAPLRGTALRRPLLAAVAGLLLGAMAASLGAGGDFTLPLLVLTLTTGALVAWARPLPDAAVALLVAAALAGTVLLLAPPPDRDLGFRLAWLGGVLLVAVALGGNALAVLQALLGRQPAQPLAPVKRLLLRVAGSWLATAALLVLALEWQRRMG
jgi:hypothetical protein